MFGIRAISAVVETKIVGTGKCELNPGSGELNPGSCELNQKSGELNPESAELNQKFGEFSGFTSSNPDSACSMSNQIEQLAQKLGRGCDIKDDKDQKINNKKGDSVEKAPHVTTDEFGNLRITIRKTKPLLGIAIEGGANTKHSLPRIINIHENGAAFEVGGLEVGQLILEVDRQKVDGMQHQAVARLIAETYANRDRKEIEFVVIEPKRSNLEPKPTALIFMDS
ncbi:hypothetical protein PGB90_010591 [Kerria lacca]